MADSDYDTRPVALGALPQGELDALGRRVRFVGFDFDGVFTDNGVYFSERGDEMVRCWRGDGIGLERLRRQGIGMAVISSAANPVVSKHCRRLRIQCFQSCEDKRAALESVLAIQGIPLAEAAFVGNDVNDAGALGAAGLPIVPADAHSDVLPLAKMVTRLTGGHGAVREVCDWLVRLREAEAAP